MTDDTSAARPATPVLDRVHQPADLKDLSDRELRQLAARVFSDLATGVLRAAPPLTFALGDAALAHAALASRDRTQSLVLMPE